MAPSTLLDFDGFDEDATLRRERFRTWLGRLVLAGAVLGLAYVLYTTLTQQTTKEREQAPWSTIIPIAPPPPPPPPKPIDEPKPVEEPTAAPSPQPPSPSPTPTPSPTPSPSAPGNAVTQDAEAQTAGAGVQIGSSGGFGGSGPGGGGGGGGFDAAGYGSYLRSAIQSALARDRVLPATYQTVVKGRVWVDATGKVTRFEFDQGTGIARYDEDIQRLVAGLTGLRAPPATVLQQLPLRFSIDHRSAF